MAESMIDHKKMKIRQAAETMYRNWEVMVSNGKSGMDAFLLIVEPVYVKAYHMNFVPCPHKEEYVDRDADGGAYCNACDSILS